MAASRSTRVTRSTVGLNGLDENFCGRTLRNRSIAHPEEVSSLPQVRSRSPKKKPESLQTQKGSNSGRTNDIKHQSSRESWVSPRKRGLSTSEKDSVDRQIVENCEKKQVEPVSPVLKRVKRCLRSEAQNSSEEVLPSKTGKDRLERKTSLSDNVAVSPGTKRACRYLILDNSDKREVKKVNACTERFNSSISEELISYQTVNGVDGRGSDAIKCDCQSDGNTTLHNADSCSSKEKSVAENGNSLAHSSFFLNRSKEDSFVDHSVPCTNSQKQLKLEDHKQLTNSLSEEPANQAHESGTGTGSFSEIQSSLLRDSEEEVDVVGDSSASKEQSAENTNSNLDNCHNSTSVSGEPEPPISALDCVSTQITSASEPQEHRYTLRTSPWRGGSAKGSPIKNNSPCRENGQPEEINHNAPGKNVESSITNISGSAINTENTQSEKESVCDLGDCVNERLSKPPSEARLVIGSLPSAKESASLHAVEDEEEEPDVYFFESDHVALKHNKDYQRLLQTIAVLEAQRTQAVQDLESLGRHQREALKDPIGFVERLQKKVDIGLPYPQRIVQLPEISWDQYTTSLGNFEREFRNRKRNSRRAKLIFDKVGLPTRPKSPLDHRKDGEATSYSVLPFSDCPEASTNNRPQQMIRGRLCDETKPETFNQLWTIEEQKKLEQLLLKYPPEEIESRRWQKIADELGNRTAKQVASRVQKYFIKLTKAGIPVPGRTPNLYLYSKKSSSRRQHPLNKHLFKPSTFMTSHEPPVYMDEDDDRSSFHSHMGNTPEEDASDEESIPVAYRELPEYKELLKLKKLKKEKLQQMHAESGFVQHVGFKCDNCGTEPIQGIRWHCQDCPPEMSLDFCDSCSDCLHETDIHKENHRLEPIYRSEMFLDRDYCMSQGASYNYLDPNYFPANR
ncbi:ZZ-type zinc finger-containing protein 3 isoform X1 [Eublepharis macularius]|uniref:ZZ-type zinc finger-containing protein 3 n=1 Tax=Eublepharis macularius TaxID=481883 RepID=A0AA97JHR0_EUBMA|nr:ZZ-type zinc finger-containing protein 3 isoform X1 [Eublepharis macularius]XP_054837972.1 ZZ-type zinc finger-containing protein 3 isoform X1 [Eublepharis macularius]XP_054837973.1 ZZ-type zinc finger-containing protein 3 isoform X1 [Eublepharis macularius]XP_054837974.1 ZZ-type zinc finger-containing protein 3 isoform X1 [Eublepharis macularius]XP_054837975.1 ZZ-type zinc finger-containing protein 3 isoform X1 [Eublepharis macularius]